MIASRPLSGFRASSRSRPLLPVILALALASISPRAAHAQFGVIRTETRVHLREEPSADSRSIRVLEALERLTAQGSAEEGFGAVRGWLPVVTTRGERGWVADRFVFEVESDSAAALALPTRGRTRFVGLDAPAEDVNTSWFKPRLRGSVLRHATSSASCGPRGGEGDGETFRRKNRNDYPDTAYALQFDAIRRLPFGDGLDTDGRTVPTNRPFPDEVEETLSRYEGIAVTITGFIAYINERGSKEATNCGFTGVDNTDWHIAITEGHRDPMGAGMVVEPTPRFVRRHPGWLRRNLAERTGDQRSRSDSVRITGYLFYDPDHRPHIRQGYRFTMWELHPVTRIEIFRDGAWVDLDDAVEP